MAKRLAKRGASGIGYGLVIGLISVVALGAITAVGSETDKLFSDVGTTLDNVVENAVPQASASASPAASASGSPVPRVSCKAQFDAGFTDDGHYPINAPNAGVVNLYCDMSNGGWTLVMRAYGGDNAGWGATTALDTAAGSTPGMASTFKLSDTDINAVRNGGIYRLSYNGNASGFSANPPTVYVPSTCTYAHTTEPSGGCLQWSENESLTPLTTSATNSTRLGIVAGHASINAGGYVHFITFANASGTTNDGYYMGDIAGSSLCSASTTGCNAVMFVK